METLQNENQVTIEFANQSQIGLGGDFFGFDSQIEEAASPVQAKSLEQDSSGSEDGENGDQAAKKINRQVANHDSV